MIEKYKVHIPQCDIDDLNERIKSARWPDELNNSGWLYGTNLGYLKELSDYWSTDFSWRAVEEKINSFPNFIATLSGSKIHFLHIKSTKKNAVPLIITHGWPGSFLEMLKIITYLNNSDELAFHLVIPSIRGFGFSEKPLEKGNDYGANAKLWHQLMQELGYINYGVQGGDIGAGISIKMAQYYPENIIGLHLNYISDSYKPFPKDQEKCNREIEAYKKYVKEWTASEGAYALVHSTKPLSLAYGLNDSPVGLCAWIIEKFHAWSDNDGQLKNCFSKDELLANVSLYWFTQTIHSSIRMYHEISSNPLHFNEDDYITVPVGFAKFPKEIPIPPRSYLKKGFNIVHWSELSKGGHFPAMEQPEILANDIIGFFKNHCISY
ncbi:Pimeloyl-ACP methyl ester carboxylesterase [Maribacter aquivivus]|uniref:Pimeloyl-ACP methyl ester carboxylesterase n=1 Tax=Maribacter aquivivus TaxID=228958 RepID=A0A1M6RH66_9FLAO|nr:epoxide hydrolase family protein [Maribacter aquivivus]SHK31773.1 Pimeloyl-ACP methyl ester carboxylesterase [Maribacter aquivivus]